MSEIQILRDIFKNNIEKKLNDIFQTYIFPLCKKAAEANKTEVYIRTQEMNNLFPYDREEECTAFFLKKGLILRISEGDHGDAPYGINISGWADSY